MCREKVTSIVAAHDGTELYVWTMTAALQSKTTS